MKYKIVISIVFLLAGCVTIVSSNYHIYRNAELGFSIRYPDPYQAREKHKEPLLDESGEKIIEKAFGKSTLEDNKTLVVSFEQDQDPILLETSVAFRIVKIDKSNSNNTLSDYFKRKKMIKKENEYVVITSTIDEKIFVIDGKSFVKKIDAMLVKTNFQGKNWPRFKSISYITEHGNYFLGFNVAGFASRELIAEMEKWILTVKFNR